MTSTDRFTAENIAFDGARAFAYASTGQDVIYSAVLGLRCVLQLAHHEDIAQLSARAIRLLSDASEAAVTEIASAPGDIALVDRIIFGMTAVADLIALFGKPREEVTTLSTFELVMDCIDHVGLLASELEIMSRRQNIEARGNPLVRMRQLRQFVLLQPATGAQLN